MKYILMIIILVIPVQAHADWVNTGMQDALAPNFRLNQEQQPKQREVRLNDTQPVRPVARKGERFIKKTLPEHKIMPDKHHQTQKRHEHNLPGYFRRDVDYYGYAQVISPYSDVSPAFAVPDGFEEIIVNGEIFYYYQGDFYQQVGDQLMAIPAVLGAVVDSIPGDYQIVMADGVHYLYTGGVYYQRVDDGFKVVQPQLLNQG